MVKLISASRSVVSDLHVKVMGLLAATETAYGADLQLRLEGGTALAAYYLGHRESEDLDFFGGPGFDARDFCEQLKIRLRHAGMNIPIVGPANPGFAELLVSEGRDSSVRQLKIQLCRSSPFQLEAPVATSEGIRVASFRDVCAGKFHAICDRFEPRDFIDLHAILTRSENNASVDTAVIRTRFRSLVADLTASDPGLTPMVIGPSVQRGRHRPLVSAFPLRLLMSVNDAEVQATLQVCCEELARIIAGDWHR